MSTGLPSVVELWLSSRHSDDDTPDTTGPVRGDGGAATLPP
jgi:hypothetical protein